MIRCAVILRLALPGGRVSWLKAFKKQAVIISAVALWLPAVVYGINVMWSYSTTPGHPASPPRFWPARAPIRQGKEGRATLLLFAHPQCECTRATLGELAILMAQAGGRLDADVFFYAPSSKDSTWVRTDLWQTATAIPGVHAFEDRDAEVAKQFGVFTSGQTLLYRSDGLLGFSGGITAFRGHSGDNAGRSAVTMLVQGKTPPEGSLPVVTRVFGCSLQGE
jgi:hypothetical protein